MLWAAAVAGAHALALAGLMQAGHGVDKVVPDRAVMLTLVPAATQSAQNAPPPAADRSARLWAPVPPTLEVPVPILPPIAEPRPAEQQSSAVAPAVHVPTARVAVVAKLEAAEAATAAPKQLTVVDYLRPPRVTYPAASRRMNEQGRVVVRVLIDADGRVLQVELEQPSPYPRLNDAALKAAREAQYRPHVEDGVPQVVWALVPLLFELRS
jgi:protein TonB